MPILRQDFGETLEGRTVELFTLTNAAGAEARVMTYGGTLVSLRVPDRRGVPGEVVLGFETLALYLADPPYFGGLIGRFGNRIARGAFRLGEITYRLLCNDGPNHLHGGAGGFHKRLWHAHPEPSPEGPALVLTYLSRDGEEGYPGNLRVRARYTLTDANELRLDYTATTDADTVVNLTSHPYFNLAGAGDVLGHRLEIAARAFLPVDRTLIPIGERRPVAGTPMDFTTPTIIGEQLCVDDEQLRFASGGFDHTWVLNEGEDACRFAARVYEPESGRTLEVFTTQPGLQFYSGNSLDGTFEGHGGQVYRKHSGFCLETQGFPDAPNQPGFPSALLTPTDTYRHTTRYRFGIGREG